MKQSPVLAVDTSTSASSRASSSWIGYVIGAICLAWVFHDVSLREVAAGLEGLRWDLVAAAVIADIASYYAQGVRWSFLLRPIAPLSPLKATQAIYAGLFTNEVVPLRLGEILRIWLAARWVRIPVLSVASSVGVERFLDALWLAGTAGFLALTVPLPSYLVGAEEVLAGIAVGSALLLIAIVVRRSRPQGAGPAPATPGWRGMLDQTVMALGKIGGSRWFYAAIGASGLYLGFQILAFWLMIRAYGMDLTLLHGAAALLILHLGTMIPGPPSNVGTYQFFTVAGLTLFGIDKPTATGFSVVVFLILTLPLWLIGLFAFGQAGLNPRHVKSEAVAIWRSFSQQGKPGD